MSGSPPTLTLAANNGDMGGGEVMLLQAAEAARALGVSVEIVGPTAIDGVVEQAQQRGFPATGLAGERRAYVRQLRSWDARERRGWLWCHGLVPALATAGRPRRIVELHRLPSSPPQKAAARVSTLRAARVLVPSRFMQAGVPGAHVLANWTEHFSPAPDRPIASEHTIGFIGRPSVDKGVDVLAIAIEELERRRPGTTRLLLAGEPRFVDETQRQVVTSALDKIQGLVTPLGWAPPQDFFARCDLVALPSTWPEPFGLVAAEAMAARRAVIVSDAGALPEVVGEDHPWIARAGDPVSLADTIERVIDTPVVQRDLVIEKAYRRWQDNFSPEAGQARVAELLGALGVLP